MKQPIIDGRTVIVGLLGWPVEHSLSPPMQNAAFAEVGLNWAYVPLPVRPEDVQAALAGLAALNIVGVNVTVPHKQAVMRYMDELSEAAQAIGAVNTIYLQDGRYYGYNTDADGFINSLIEAGCHPKGMRVAVLGAGGAARAVVFALAWAKAASVTVLNRTAQRAAFLVDDLVEVFPDQGLHFAPLTSEALVALEGEIDLVINTTSVGMSPNFAGSPWPDDVPLSANLIVCDLVYNPMETMLIKQAKAAGAKTVIGMGMLVHQGAAAFERWTGQSAPVETMREVCLKGLQK